MMFFIMEAYPLKLHNNKSRELFKWLHGFDCRSLSGHSELGILYDKFKLKAASLDVKHPRTKPLRVEKRLLQDGLTTRFSFYQAGTYEEVVTSIDVKKVMGKANLCFYEPEEEGGC